MGLEMEKNTNQKYGNKKVLSFGYRKDFVCL